MFLLNSSNYLNVVKRRCTDKHFLVKVVTALRDNYKFRFGEVDGGHTFNQIVSQIFKEIEAKCTRQLLFHA